MVDRQRSVVSFGRVIGAALSLASVPAAAHEWQAVAINGSAPLEAPAIRFSADGALSGTTGCNGFRGTARFEGGALVIDAPVATTRMACPGEGLTLQDDTLIAFFSGRIAIAFDPLRDALRLTKDDTFVDLARMPAAGSQRPDLPETHAGLGRPSGEPPYLNPFGLSDDMPIHAQPDTASDVVGRAFLGQVVRNEGCQDEWCRLATLDGTISGWGERQYLEASDHVLRAGQGVFDAAGTVPCAQGLGAPMTSCAMGVARGDDGTAMVVVTKPDGVDRQLFFTDGEFVNPDMSQAGGGFEFSVERESDLHLIRVDDERYEIPDAVIFGG
jgi:heat shock protein HslJ